MEKQLKITIEDLSKINAELFIELRVDMIPQIKRLIKEKFSSMNKFSKILGINVGDLSTRLSRKHKTNILLAVKISKLLGINLTNIVEKVTTRKRNGCFISVETFPIKDSVELASLVGHSFADGHINKETFSFTNKAEKLITEVIDRVKSIGFKNVKPNRWFNGATTIRFSVIVRCVIELAGGVLGNKTTRPFEIPNWIKNGSKAIKSAFLKALFNDDGSVKSNRSITLSFSKTEELQDNLIEFLNDINSLLKEFGIKGTKIKRGETWISKNGTRTIPRILTITSTKNFITFQSFIGFSHPKKCVLLKRMINSVNKIRLRNGEGQKKILNLLKNQKLTNKEIANLLNISSFASIEHLRKLEKKKLIERIKPNKIWKPHVWLLKNDKNHSVLQWERWCG